jgi:hypothetical protein
MDLESFRAHPCSPGHNPKVLIGTLLMVTGIAVLLLLTGLPTRGEISAIELSQSVLLLLACVAHGKRSYRLPSASLARLIHTGLALLTYSFLLRELPIHEFGGSQAGPLLQNTLRLIGAVLWLGVLLMLLRTIKPIYAEKWQILALPVMRMTVLGCLLYAASWPFDKEVFAALSPALSAFVEEVIELNACVLLFLASLARSSMLRLS